MPDTSQASVLVVEDQASMRQLIEDYLRSREFQVTCCDSAEAAWKLLHLPAPGQAPATRPPLDAGEFDAVLTDLNMPGLGGLELCSAIHQTRPEIPVIVMTAYGSLETAIHAIRSGAFDFVTKPVELELLVASLRRATERTRLQREIRRLQAEAADNRFATLIGESDVMRRLRSQLERVVPSDASVLLTGESGTGKEVVAQALHAEGPRADRPFIAVNCAALPEQLIESELFGHVRGAFTDARADRDGLFVQAHGGTLFLDEIGELPLEMQPKLLRALEQKTVRPVGGEKERAFDVRLITATNRDLDAEVEQQRFREDLFYRINVLTLSVPPLRTRGNDVLLLANHFLQEFGEAAGKPDVKLDGPVTHKLLAYDWPGNVRELRNVIERAVVLSPGNLIQIDALPRKIAEFQSDQLVLSPAANQPLESLAAVEDRYIRFVLEQTGGNKTEAAKILGLDRKTLYRKLNTDRENDDSA